MTSSSNPRIEVLYEKKETYQIKLRDIEHKLTSINKKWNVPYELIQISSLSATKIEEIKSALRSIPPQVRGRIVSTKKLILPLSGNKNLNVQKTPIILLYGKQVLIDAYPHALGVAYFSIDNFLEQLHNFGPNTYATARGLLEDPIIQLIRDNPSLLEDNAKFIDLKLKVESGEIDIVLKDKENKPIVIEVETKATDFAIGQVCRLAHSYSISQKISDKHIRKAIVYLLSNSGFIQAAKGANVETYHFKLIRRT